jgi:hypothetical protein
MIFDCILVSDDSLFMNVTVKIETATILLENTYMNLSLQI